MPGLPAQLLDGTLEEWKAAPAVHECTEGKKDVPVS